ncbi:MAG: lysostaphin resistance A-like protein [Phormidesmis sp.]
MAKLPSKKPKLRQSDPEQPNLESLSRTELLVAMAATAIILLLIARIWQFFEPVRLPVTFQWLDAGVGLTLGLAISAASAVTYRLWTAYRKSADTYLSFVLAPLYPSDCLWIGLLPGMSEELLFRGVMLPALGLNATGLLFSSVCFGIMHMSKPHQWPYAIWATAVGLLLGSSVLVTGNLLVPILAHITTNFVSSLFRQISHR